MRLPIERLEAVFFDAPALPGRNRLDAAVIERHRDLAAARQDLDPYQNHVHGGLDHKTWQHALAVGGPGDQRFFVFFKANRKVGRAANPDLAIRVAAKTVRQSEKLKFSRAFGSAIHQQVPDIVQHFPSIVVEQFHAVVNGGYRTDQIVADARTEQFENTDIDHIGNGFTTRRLCRSQ